MSPAGNPLRFGASNRPTTAPSPTARASTAPPRPAKTVHPSGDTTKERTIRNVPCKGLQTTRSRAFASPFAPAFIHAPNTATSASDNRCAPTLFCAGGMYGFSSFAQTR
jgi:hypothetical protein